MDPDKTRVTNLLLNRMKNAANSVETFVLFDHTFYFPFLHTKRITCCGIQYDYDMNEIVEVMKVHCKLECDLDATLVRLQHEKIRKLKLRCLEANDKISHSVVDIDEEIESDSDSDDSW